MIMRASYPLIIQGNISHREWRPTPWRQASECLEMYCGNPNPAGSHTTIFHSRVQTPQILEMVRINVCTETTPVKTGAGFCRKEYGTRIVRSSFLDFDARGLPATRPLTNRLGWMLVEYTELTGKYSTLRGPPRDTGFVFAYQY
jgi:hypothetical protein